MSGEWMITENRELNEKLYRRRIHPGMDLYVLPKAGYQKKYAAFSTHFGSIDNKFQIEGSPDLITVPDGVAHFLEHKLFEDERGNVFDRFAALGASSNAFTTFTHTTYLFSCTEFFHENLELLLDFVQEPYFTAETVRKEQGIIGQEIRMYDDNPQWRIYFNLLEALYREHPVRNDIAGTVESIAQITPELLHQCYKAYYHPSNMAVFVTGDIEPDQIGRQVEENLGKRGYSMLGEIMRFYPEEGPAVGRQRVSQELVVSEPLFNLGFKDPAVNKLSGRDLLRREIGMELLVEIIFGQSETLFNELYQDGLIDDSFDAGYTAESSYAYTLIGGKTRDPDELYRRVMDGISKVKRDGISAEQFERHRRSQLGGYMRRFNSLEFIANNFLAYRFKDSDLFDFPALLQDVKRDEVTALLEENLDPGRHAVSLILPRAAE
ncbi:MAG: pitrilysin family protein [Bacillota bacterium]